MLVGRDPEADLLLNDTQISRRHAFLQAVAGRVYWIDLESRTKVFEDGQEVPQSQGCLDPGHFIQVGPYRLHRTDRRTDEPTGPVVTGSEANPLPRPLLELPFRVGGKSPTWEMDSLQALVGRADQCQLVLTDPSVSRQHASLVRTPMGLWVVDLLAREGVYVNGTRVRWAWLAEGDVVRLGLFTLIVRYENPPEQIRREDVPLEAGASPPAPADVGPGVSSSPPDHQPRALAIRSGFPRTELVKAEAPWSAVPAIAPAVSSRGEWEPVLPTNANLFSMWQQQMQLMESFHNDMVMMVQMFVAMHREHQATVRDELGRVQQLTKELTRLNAQLAHLPAPGPARPSPEASRKASSGEPASPAVSPKPESSPRARSAQRSTEETSRKPPEPAEKPRKKRPAAAPEEKEGPLTAAMPAMSGPEMYAHLTRKITDLQRERQGYWQRILKVING